MAIGITGKFKPDGDFPLMDAQDIEMPDGSRLPDIKGLPAVSVDDNGKFLQVADGVWVAVDAVPQMTELVKFLVGDMFVPVSQEEYDALVFAGTVDESKYYLIVG